MRYRGALAALATAALTFSAGSALAQAACYVSDPTGTPLNIRIEPNGRVVGTVRNGVQVTISETRYDSRGRAWVFIRDLDSGRGIGWVYRSFLNC